MTEKTYSQKVNQIPRQGQLLSCCGPLRCPVNKVCIEATVFSQIILALKYILL